MTTDAPSDRADPPPPDALVGCRASEWADSAAFRLALRGLLDAVAAARPPAATWTTGAAVASELAEQLKPFGVPEPMRITGNDDKSGDRGLLLLPRLDISTSTANVIDGHVVFGEHFHGTNRMAHGGAVSLLFDELFGRLANAGGRPRMRTAYLHVNYRSATPVNRRLSVRVAIRAIAGRKLTAYGELRDGGRLLAECECLLVALRPGQP